MNEIQPSNIKYVLWSDDDEYSNKSMLSRDQFSHLVNSILIKNDLIGYGNVEYDGSRHNDLIEFYPNTLDSHIKANRWYTTWFIDDNNDLWCRDTTYSTGINYYLLREFNNIKDADKLTIKMNLSLDLDTFDSDILLDNTSEIGSRLINELNLNRLNEINNDSNYNANSQDLIYMTMLINQELNNVLSNNSFDLDTLSDMLVESLNAWYERDKKNGVDKPTINSMKEFINEYDKMIIAFLNEASYESISLNEKGKEL